MTEPNPELAQDIRDIRFTPVRLRNGYDMGDVDTLCDRLAYAADHGDDLVPVCEGARFRLVKLREGYDMGEVDEFLARLARGQSVRRVRRPRPPGPPAGSSGSVPAAPSVIESRPGLFGRLFGNR